MNYPGSALSCEVALLSRRPWIRCLLVLLLSGVPPVFARDFRPAMMPNGTVNRCINCHISSNGGGQRNAFGQDVLDIVGGSSPVQFWDPFLASLDSDGDGLTNGQELGDPDGDGTPTPGSVITNPGNAQPKVQITKPVSNAPFLLSESIVVEATASDTGGSITRVEFRVGTISLGVDTTAPYSRTIAAGSLAAGSHNLTAIATDNQGERTTSAVVTITVQSSVNQLPTVSFLRPPAGRIVAKPATVEIEASAADADGTIARVELLLGTNVVATITNAPFVFKLATTALSPGTLDLGVRSTDNKGAASPTARLALTLLPEILIQSSGVTVERAFEMAWAAPVGTVFVVEASANLTAWTPVGNVTATATGAKFTEIQPPNTATRFYRVGLPE